MFACVKATGSILLKTLQAPVGRSVCTEWACLGKFSNILGVSQVVCIQILLPVSDPQLFY